MPKHSRKRRKTKALASEHTYARLLGEAAVEEESGSLEPYSGEEI